VVNMTRPGSLRQTPGRLEGEVGANWGALDAYRKNRGTVPPPTDATSGEPQAPSRPWLIRTVVAVADKLGFGRWFSR